MCAYSVTLSVYVLSTGTTKGDKFAPFVTHQDVMVGSRVRLTDNLWTAGGLYNGAMATVFGFIYKGNGPSTPDEYCPRDFGALTDSQREQPIVLLQMDDGYSESCSQDVPRLVPIDAVEGLALIKNDYKRCQYPFVLAHARTGHSIQGYTARFGVVVDTGSQFYGGDYVAIGRATDLELVFLLKPAKISHYTSFISYRLLVQQTYAKLEELFPQDLYA